MFARLAWGKVKPGTWGEYERIYHANRIAGALA